MQLPSENDFNSFQQNTYWSLPQLYQQIQDPANIAAVTNGVPGAAQNDAARKSRVEQIIQQMRDYSTRLDQTIGSIQREHASISRSVGSEKEHTEALRNEYKEKEELAELRREQASDLKYKYSANYHSSLLGLWRPLHPNTRGVLYTVCIVLTILAIISVVYLVIVNYGTESFSFITSPAKSVFGFFSKGAGAVAGLGATATSAATSLFEQENNNGLKFGGGRSKK